MLFRSGVLGETSVHSFVDPGMWAYWILLCVIFLFAGIGFGLLFIRRKEMPKIPVEHSIMSREFAIFLGASALCFTAIFVAVGTSSPIITGIFQGKKSAIDISFYAKTTLPFGIIIALLMGIGQMLWWRSSQTGTLLKSLLLPIVFALVFTIIMLAVGVRDLMIVLFIFSAAFALAVNVLVGYRIMKGNPKYAGGAIAHIGMALMFIGFVSSSRYDDKQTVSLEEGKTISILKDYKLTYLGYSQVEREKYAFNVRVEKGNEVHIVSPIMYFSEFTNGLMRIPDILNRYTQDFYVAPISLESPNDKPQGEIFAFKKGEVKQIDGMNVTFLDFDFNDEEKGKMVTGEGGVTIGVDLLVEKDGKKDSLKPLFKMERGQQNYIPAKHPSGYEFTISKMTPDKENKENSRVEISVVNPNEEKTNTSTKETLVVEASVKPYINLVWMGTALMVIGFVVTIVRRLDEARRNEHVAISSESAE